MYEFQLFRIKVFPPAQIDAFGQEISKTNILIQAMKSLPSAELRKGMIWHVGNVIRIDGDCLYFRVGRTTKSTIEVYQDGSFADQEFETAPYTHAVIDANLEVCAIAKKTRLSPKTTGVAQQFMHLLNSAVEVQHLRASFEVDEILDPEDFIAHLQKAYAIFSFWLTFSKPNPFDVDDDFVKPAQKLLKESNGNKGKLELKGDTLRHETLEKLARSAGSTGDDAGAWLKSNRRGRKVKKHLKGNPVMIQHEDVGSEEERRSLLSIVRERYQRLRGK